MFCYVEEGAMRVYIDNGIVICNIKLKHLYPLSTKHLNFRIEWIRTEYHDKMSYYSLQTFACNTQLDCLNVFNGMLGLAGSLKLSYCLIKWTDGRDW